MNIIGEKVILRAIETEDCDLLRKIINDPETEYFIGGWTFPVSQTAQQHWFESILENDTVLRTMIDVDGKAIGTAILTSIDYKNGTAEIHIKLKEGNCRKQGYGTDTIRTLTNYAFSELRLNCIYAQISEHNLSSQKLFQKCGFEFEGKLRQRLYKKGSYVDVLMFSILKQVGQNHE